MAKLTEQAVQARRDYFKDWREKNKDKCKEYKARYWEKRAKSQSQRTDNGGDKLCIAE